MILSDILQWVTSYKRAKPGLRNKTVNVRKYIRTKSVKRANDEDGK